MIPFGKRIRHFAEVFVDLQDERHRADYDPAWTRFKSHVADRIEEGREAVQGYAGIRRNSFISDQKASAYITAPSRKGAPGNSIGALSEVK